MCNIDALYFNWLNDLDENYKDTQKASEKFEAQVDALGLPFMDTIPARCAAGEYSERCQHQGFVEGFKTAVSLIFQWGGVLHNAR